MSSTAIDNKRSLTAAIIVVWTLILLIAFFSYRGDDIGKLGQLFGNPGAGPLFSPGIFDSLVGLLAAQFILLAWLGLGSLIAKFFPVLKKENPYPLLDPAIHTGIGAAVWSLIWFTLGLIGLYNSTSALVALVLGLLINAVIFLPMRDGKRESKSPEPVGTNTFEKLLIALIAFPVILALIASLAPPTAKDTLLYHFALPKAFIAQGSNAFVEGNIVSYLALGTEMHSVWAMLLGGIFSQRAAEAAAGAVNFLFFPLLLLTIFGWARELKMESSWALAAVLIVAGVPTAYHVAASAYIDLALALYVSLAIYALTRWWKSLAGSWLVLTAIFLGAALSAKLTAIFVIAACALVILLKARNTPGKVFVTGFAALVFACVIASPWYLRTWRETGSPVFPFYMSIAGGEAPGWDVERSNLFQAMNSQYGGAKKEVADYLLAPWNLSVIAQPEQAEFFDGVLGVAFLIGLPFLIFALWKLELPVEIKIACGVAAIIFLFWLFSSQQLRYLLPILPVIAIGIAATFAAMKIRIAQFALIFSAFSTILVGAAWFLQKAPHRVVLGGETRDGYLTRNLDYYPFYRWLNSETPSDAKVWLINMRRDTYTLDRPYFSDYLFEDWSLRKMIWESQSVEELKKKTAAMGIQYVLTRHDFLFDYKRSTIVDDKKSRAENEAKLKIAREFILDKANTVKADEKFSLIKVN